MGWIMGLKREDEFKTEERVNLEGCNRRVVMRREIVRVRLVWFRIREPNARGPFLQVSLSVALLQKLYCPPDPAILEGTSHTRYSESLWYDI